jgi:putative acetyltransferase
MRDAVIRLQEAGDAEAVDAVLRAAFAGEDEVRLVGALRARGELALALVAACADGIVGYVAFEEIAVAPAPGYPVWALAPIAVHPECQRKGIGAALVRDGLARAKAAGVGFVAVLGEPDYYARFGFRAELAHGLEVPWPGPYFMGLKLGEVPTPIGAARYPAPFLT